MFMDKTKPKFAKIEIFKNVCKDITTQSYLT